MGATPNQIMFDREEGINAIIKLQGFVDIEETRAQAERGWDNMNDREKESTMGTYKMLYPNGN